MIVRELLTLLGFTVDDTGALKYEQRTEAARRTTEAATSRMSTAWGRFNLKMDKGLAKVDAGLERLQTGASNLSGALGGAASMLGGAASMAMITKVTSSFTDLQSRIKLAVDGTEESSSALMDSLKEVAMLTYQSIEGTIEGFLQMKPGLDRLGMSLDDQVTLMTSLNDAMTVGGVKGQQAARVQMWLNRSFSAGRMTTEAFNNILEAGDDIINQLSKSTGKSIEQLREMAKAGELTGEVLRKHFLDTAAEMRVSAEEMPVTLVDALQRIRMATEYWLFQVDRAGNYTGRLATTLLWFAERPAVAGTIAIGAVALGMAAMVAQAVAVAASLLRAGGALIRWTLALRGAEVAAALANPFAWAAIAAVAIQDLTVAARGGDSQIGHLVGSMKELEAKSHDGRTALENWAHYMMRYAGSVDEATTATRAFAQAASTPPADDQSWFAWADNLADKLNVVLFGRADWQNWRPFTIEGGFAEEVYNWFSGIGEQADKLCDRIEEKWDQLWTELPKVVSDAARSVFDPLKTAWDSALAELGRSWSTFVNGLPIPEFAKGWLGVENPATGEERAAQGRELGRQSGVNVGPHNYGTFGQVPGDGGTLIDGRRARGGPVRRGGLYLVGEEGPEIIEMGGQGFVTPAPQSFAFLDRMANSLATMRAAIAAPALAGPAAFTAPGSRAVFAPTVTNNVTVSGADLHGMSPGDVAGMIADRIGSEFDSRFRDQFGRAFGRELGRATRHFTEQEE